MARRATARCRTSSRWADTDRGRRSSNVAATAVRSFRVFGNLVQKAGPYLLLEILLPGGTLFALLLLLYQRRQQSGAANGTRLSVLFARAVAKVRGDALLPNRNNIQY